MRVECHTDPAAYERLVTPLLLEDEPRYNLELAIIGKVAAGEYTDPPPVLLSVHDDGGALVGAAFQTPPYNLGLGATPPEAAPYVADWAADHDVTPPGILGSVETVAAFAARYQERTGRVARTSRDQGVYVLHTLVAPRPTTGALRQVTHDEATLVTEWDHAFVAEVALPAHAGGHVHERIDEGLVWFWDDGGPVTLVACGGMTPHGARIGPVYTPPEFRNRGYASAATAAASQELFDRGRDFCFLYTDLANPTSNGIYRAIGYQHVTDVREATFD
jgi:ribosomal protein S18 acetylase RimI-like enzyme